MAAKRFNFTKKDIDALPAPTKSVRAYYHDTREAGLSISITPVGTKTFFLRKKIEGRDERIVLGRYPDLTLENARKLATQRKGEIAVGKNPQAEKRAVRDEMTFEELFELYMERFSRKYKRSWKYDEREVSKHLSHFYKRKISTIRNEEIHKLHTELGEKSGIYQANRILERIRAIYNKGIEWGWNGRNPALGVKKYREKSRDRFLLPEEVSRFFESLAKEENVTARDFILMALLTGARKGNVLAMQWSEINFQHAIWRIPDTKNGDPHNVTLSPQAMQILEKRKKVQQLTEQESIYVFPGDGAGGHLADPKKAWYRLLQEAKIENLRIHDLRRTLGSWQALQGTSTAIIGKSLGHKSQQSTAVYERLTLEPVRHSVQSATEALFLAAKKKQECA